MNRRKGTPCACECDPCNSKNPVRAINNVSPEPNGDFTIEAGNGIGISAGENKITIINQSMASSFVAGDNIEINPSGNDLEIRLKDNVVIGGDLTVNGTYYTVHAEHVYTEDDYIIMRDGATTGLGSGDFSGFQVKLYDGVNDGRLVIDNSGTARVGDVGDEQPLLTREESANLNDGALLKWDAGNSKAVDEGTVGTDTKPIKIVNGVATVVTNDLVSTQGNQNVYGVKAFYGNIDLRIGGGKGWIDAYYDSAQQHSGVTINSIDVADSTNNAGIFVIYDASTQKARIVLRKTINNVPDYRTVYEF